MKFQWNYIICEKYAKFLVDLNKALEMFKIPTQCVLFLRNIENLRNTASARHATEADTALSTDWRSQMACAMQPTTASISPWHQCQQHSGWDPLEICARLEDTARLEQSTQSPVCQDITTTKLELLIVVLLGVKNAHLDSIALVILTQIEQICIMTLMQVKLKVH